MRIYWVGPVGLTGYGRITNFVLPKLSELGVDIHLDLAYQNEISSMSQELFKFYNPTDINQLDADVSIRLSIANPSDAMSFHGNKRVIFTMLEVDKIPPFWVKALNTLDQVWTPSKWGKKVFKSSGVKRPVKVVPLGVDLNIFNPYRDPLVQKEDNFRFLFVGKWETRKGVDILVKAFSDEFKQNEKVELMLVCGTAKWFQPNFNIFNELLSLRLPQDRAGLKIVEGIIPKYEDMGRIYTSADCFVAPTRGEGWNLPLLEAMATRLPCISTNWSGQTEFINDKNCYLLNDFTLVSASGKQQLSNIFLQFGKWAEPNPEELKEKMRYVFDNQNEAKKKAKKAYNTAKKFTWENTANIIYKHLMKMIE